MEISSFFKLFQPKDRIFFTLFEEIAENLIKMSNDFNNDMHNPNIDYEVFVKKVKNYENENDRITHNVYVELGHNFITPFDREDILALLTALDDVADFMYASANCLKIFKAPYMSEYATFSELIDKSVKELHVMIYGLRDLRKHKQIKVSCVEVNRIENLADELFAKSISDLFESNRDVLDVVRIKNIYQNLEDVTDKCESCANIIDTILLKYS